MPTWLIELLSFSPFNWLVSVAEPFGLTPDIIFFTAIGLFAGLGMALGRNFFPIKEPARLEAEPEY